MLNKTLYPTATAQDTGESMPESAGNVSENAVDLINIIRRQRIYMDMFYSPTPTPENLYDLVYQLLVEIDSLKSRVLGLEGTEMSFEERGCIHVEDPFTPDKMADIGTVTVRKLLNHLLQKRAIKPPQLTRSLPASITDPPTQSEVEQIRLALVEMQTVFNGIAS